jgi:DNA mismatch endonuclease (patch repair protein)
MPVSNPAFWHTKLDGNVARDHIVQEALARAGWRSLVVWQCELRKREEIARGLRHFLTGDNE